MVQKIDTKSADWIQKNVPFPNSMVDCITPTTGNRERKVIQDLYQMRDTVPVFCEHFSQWVLEDTFTMGRPQLECVGVEFVTDVTDYEKMKIRILNGGHAILAYVSGLLEIEFVHNAINTPLIRAYLSKIETEEILPLIPTIGNMTPQKYYHIMEHRLCNHKVKDTIQHLCFDGYNRQPKFIVPSIKECLHKGYSVVGLALTSALWCRYCVGTTDKGNAIAPNDDNWHTLQHYAKLAKYNPHIWLQMKNVYGDLDQSRIFSDIFSTWLQKIWQDGVEKTLVAYINNDIPVCPFTPLQVGDKK